MNIHVSWTLAPKQFLWYQYQKFTTFLNVKFIRGPQGVFSGGTEWSQYFWVCPFITRRSPACKRKQCLLELDLSFDSSMNLLDAPRLTDAITGSSPNNFSSSACLGTIDFSSRYRLTKQLLKLVPMCASNVWQSLSISSFVEVGYGASLADP